MCPIPGGIRRMNEISSIFIDNGTSKSVYDIKDALVRSYALSSGDLSIGINDETSSLVLVVKDGVAGSVPVSSIGNKIWVYDAISGTGGQTDLSVVKLSAEDYYQMVVRDNVVSNVLYVIDQDYVNVYGEQIRNLSAGTDVSDAVNLGQLQSGLSGRLLPGEVRMSYDSASRKMTLSSRSVISEVDCNDFIKDGMLSSAELCGTVLWLKFNTDAQ